MGRGGVEGGAHFTVNTQRYSVYLTLLAPISQNVKHTQTICRQFADELFECVWPFCGIGA